MTMSIMPVVLEQTPRVTDHVITSVNDNDCAGRVTPTRRTLNILLDHASQFRISLGHYGRAGNNNVKFILFVGQNFDGLDVGLPTFPRSTHDQRLGEAERVRSEAANFSMMVALSTASMVGNERSNN